MTKGLGEQGRIDRGIRLPLRPGRRPSVLIDHPVEVPLRVRQLPQRMVQLEDPGLGGIRFSARRVVRPGTFVEVCTELSGESISLQGLIIAWARRGPEAQLDLVFLDQQAAFEGRMLEQACHIEAYRLRTAARGRAITVEEAAREWISRYSATFPAPAQVA